MTINFQTTSPEQTEQFASNFARALRSGDVITLDGDLGAGKTCFTRGLVRGIGSPSHVSSPTFTIVNEYTDGRLPVFHFDTYRLGDSDEFLASGLDEYFYENGVCVIEWSNIITDVIPSGSFSLVIKGSGDTRDFEMTGPDDRMAEVKAIVEEMNL